MPTLAKNRVLFAVIAAVLIVTAATAAIFWARGFKPSLQNGKVGLGRTGLIVVTSLPTGAEVFLDNRRTSATNTTIGYLDPKSYKVKIEKEGYTAWEKDIDVKADLATEIKVLLFPVAPEIKPLSSTGASAPNLSPDGTKIVYGTGGINGGLNILPMTERPFPFSQSVQLIAKNSQGFDFTRAKFIWGPDSKELIAQITGIDGQNIANLLIDTGSSQQDLKDITASQASTLKGWQDQIDTLAQTAAQVIPDEVKSATAESKTATPSLTPSSKITTKLPTTNYQLNYFPTGLMHSPDEEKVLYKNKENKYKVYDLKLKKEFTLPDFTDLINISWFPDSAHLVVAQKDIISVIETDGTNRMTVYSGKFENGFVFINPSGTRLIILTALTQPEGSPANLYSINLR